jgi:S-adenosylmethionine:tRNA ribosyltransferase-isomerase
MTNLNDYDFELPPELIANTPANPRDSARLFVYDTSIDMVAFDTFKNIGKFLPKNTLFVLNDSKVVPARLWLKKTTGGKIEVLLMINELRPKDTLVKGITDRKVEVGAKLYFNSGDFLEIIKKEEQFYYFKPSVSFANLKLLLTKEGQTPIPPYIKDTPLTEKELERTLPEYFCTQRNVDCCSNSVAPLHTKT